MLEEVEIEASDCDPYTTAPNEETLIGTSKYRHAKYLKDIIITKNLAKKVKFAQDYLNDKGIVNFDSFAFTGVSGMLIGVPVALAMDKAMLIVRKPSKKCHSRLFVEGLTTSKKYIIIDDFVDSGETVLEMIKKIKKFAPKARCIGIFEVLKPWEYQGEDATGRLNDLGLTRIPEHLNDL